MQAQVEQRLRELKTEFETGQQMLADLEAKQANLQQTLLRISGAIQVLEEELAKAAAPTRDSPAPAADIDAAPSQAVVAPGYAVSA